MGLSEQQEEDLRLAALLHDIGHYPYSHLLEGLDNVKLTEEEIGMDSRTVSGGKRLLRTTRYPGHEELGCIVVAKQRSLTKALGGEQKAREIGDLFTRSTVRNAQFSKLITSSFDLDRLDYLLRDSCAAGVPYGHIDMNYLLNSIKLSKEGMLGFPEKALPAVEQFLMARFFMYRVVYYHKTTYGIEEACRQLLRRVRDKGEYGVPTDGDKVKYIAESEREWAGFDDSFVDTVVGKALEDKDGSIRCLAKAIQTRKPPKLLKEVLVLVPEKAKDHAGATFGDRVKDKLGKLIGKHGVLPGQFIYSELKPLALEKAERRMTHEQWEKMADSQKQQVSREEDEIIRVFVADKPEPVSVTDVPYSIISKFRDSCFRIFRLYFVPREKDKAELVGALREEVENWTEH
jgi:hypothetical protein